jgi:D-alanyl-D-alanine endopeptidase (penicillin-binding protein 7)
LTKILLALMASGVLAGGSIAAQPVAPNPSDRGYAAKARSLELKSAAVLVVGQQNGRALYAKNTDAVMPIASITKLMTAMVVLDSQLALNEPITITVDDLDDIKGTRSRLKVGTKLTRGELTAGADGVGNRAAAALTRLSRRRLRFVAAMNQKAVESGMCTRASSMARVFPATTSRTLAISRKW